MDFLPRESETEPSDLDVARAVIGVLESASRENGGVCQVETTVRRAPAFDATTARIRCGIREASIMLSRGEGGEDVAVEEIVHNSP